MKVKATAKGQYKGVMHSVGDVFEFDQKDLSSPIAPWMVPVKEVEKETEKHDTDQSKKKGWA